MSNNDDYMLPHEVAGLLGVTTSTLANWRNNGKGPPFIPGNRALYSKQALYEWIKRERCLPEADIDTLRAELGSKFTKAFSRQGAIWFAQGLSFQEAKKRWHEMCQAEADELRFQLGPNLARFAAHFRVKGRRDEELKEETT